MRLAVLKERGVSEFRVAATPDTVKKLVGLGLTVAIEAGAGLTAAIADSDYAAAGAEIVPDAQTALTGANIVFAVQMPGPDIRRMFLRPCLLVCTANAFADPSVVTELAQAASIAPRWSCCPASPAPSRWTCCPARPTSPAIAR